MEISTVAVGTDGSGTASEAVQAAADLARHFDAKLVLLSAFQGSGSKQSSEPSERQWAVSPSARVKEILARTESALKNEGVDCSTQIDEGDPAEVIVRLAEECGADLLVIGNRGMQRRVLGSVPNKVSHRAPCDVLIVQTA